VDHKSLASVLTLSCAVVGQENVSVLGIVCVAVAVFVALNDFIVEAEEVTVLDLERLVDLLSLTVIVRDIDGEFEHERTSLSLSVIDSETDSHSDNECVLLGETESATDDVNVCDLVSLFENDLVLASDAVRLLTSDREVVALNVAERVVLIVRDAMCDSDRIVGDADFDR
jgi:hypothetical protein